jgi:hypothetical protein
MRGAVIAAAITLSVLGAAGAYYVAAGEGTPHRPASEQVGRPEGQALPERWTQRAVTPDEEEAGILLRLERTRPTSSFLMRSIIGDLQGDVSTSAIADATEAALRRDVRGLGQLTQEIVVNRDREVAHLRYEQSLSKAAPATTDLYILPTQRQTFYLSFRTDAADHEALSKERETILNQVIATIHKKAR